MFKYIVGIKPTALSSETRKDLWKQPRTTNWSSKASPKDYDKGGKQIAASEIRFDL